MRAELIAVYEEKELPCGERVQIDALFGFPDKSMKREIYLWHKSTWELIKKKGYYSLRK